MTYLSDLGFSKEVINIIEENFSEGSLEALKEGKFTAISIIGKGTFGIVYRAKKRSK